MKKLEGKKVFLRATGNNARRGSGEKIIPAVINKVARVFATVTIGDSRYERKYRINGMHLDSGHNSGYFVFASEQDLADKLFVEHAASKISEKFRYQRDYSELDRGTITKVADLLGVKL